jgi:hypothetical protein
MGEGKWEKGEGKRKGGEEEGRPRRPLRSLLRSLRLTLSAKQ